MAALTAGELAADDCRAFGQGLELGEGNVARDVFHAAIGSRDQSGPHAMALDHPFHPLVFQKRQNSSLTETAGSRAEGIVCSRSNVP